MAISTIAYNYDHANRILDVDGVLYEYDNNGNLLNDGTNTYTYDSANRLKTFSGQGNNVTYAYSGLGDRLQETVNGNAATFTMDLNTGLTQALSDGTNIYVYGVGRIAQINTTTEYFLGDALGSVRQMVNAGGAITYARMYDPYGSVLAVGGSSQSAYGYTSEYTSQGLVYLRARHYAPSKGRFLTRDTWGGDYNRPLSLNRWVYAEGNAINYTDPSGHCIFTGIDTVACLIALAVGIPVIAGVTTAALVCSPWLACSREEVVDALTRFTFPGQNPFKPVQPRELNFVAPFGWFPGTGFEYLGTIRSFISLGLQVSNVSEPTHIFHKGQVDRQAVPRGRAWYVLTHGTGNNIYLLMDAVNQITGGVIFNDVDWMMRRYLETTHILNWIKGIHC